MTVINRTSGVAGRAGHSRGGRLISNATERRHSGRDHGSRVRQHAMPPLAARRPALNEKDRRANADLSLEPFGLMPRYRVILTLDRDPNGPSPNRLFA